MEENKNTKHPFLRAIQFVFGLSFFGFAIYGWKVLEMASFLMIILGFSALGVAYKAIDIEDDNV